MRFPFDKFLAYLAVISRYDREIFAESLELYLPSVNFNNENILDYARNLISLMPIPKSVIDGDYSTYTFNIFLRQQKLLDLHGAMNDPVFQDIIFDSDKRLQIDGMSLSSVFHFPDIVKEFSDFNESYLRAYTDCISNYHKMQYNKAAYIETYIGDKYEREILKKVLINISRKFLRILLKLNLQDLSPQKMISEALNIADFKTQEAFANADDIKLEKWIKMKVVIAEKLHKIGAGAKSDLDDLIEKLKLEAEYEDPVIYSKEELDSLYMQNKDNQ